MFTSLQSHLKVTIHLAAVTASPSHDNTFVMIFETEDKSTRLPIFIDSFEAHNLVFVLKEQSEHFAHGLFSNILANLNVKPIEVYIYDIREGIFRAKLYLESEGEVYDFEARPSDCIALSAKMNIPVSIDKKVLETTGLAVELEGEDEEIQQEKSKDDTNNIPLYQLEKALKEAISNEDYERAAAIRDKMDKR